MNGLHPIKMPSAKEKVAAELRKAILSRQLQEGEAVTLESVANQLEGYVLTRDSGENEVVLFSEGAADGPSGRFRD